MAEFPALPLFTDAYMADTRHLSAAQHGAYLLLLMTAWRLPDCQLPNDDKFLSRCASMDLRTWKANREVVMAFWNLDPNTQKFRQERLLDERKYVDDMKSKNSKAGKASALKRKNRGSTTVKPKPNQDPTPIPTPIIEIDKSISELAPHIMPFAADIPHEWKAEAMAEMGWPENVTNDIWANFREYWRNGKGKNTKRNEWSASWRTWYRKEKLNTGGSYAKQSKPTTIDIIKDGIELARAQREQAGASKA